MASRIEITCINKAPRLDPHERISHVGGVNADGTSWRLDLDAAIRGVEGGTYQFYTRGGGREVDVVAATHNGHKYLKTRNDGIQPDNLLALTECR